MPFIFANSKWSISKTVLDKQSSFFFWALSNVIKENTRYTKMNAPLQKAEEGYLGGGYKTFWWYSTQKTVGFKCLKPPQDALYSLSKFGRNRYSGVVVLKERTLFVIIVLDFAFILSVTADPANSGTCEMKPMNWEKLLCILKKCCLCREFILPIAVHM
jgi:hypothetical protein